VKVGDLVTTRSGHFIGVIIDSKIIEARSSGGKMINNHHVYWSSPKVEKNPVWVNESDLVRAIS
jgi:hypothetical protein